MMRANLTPLTDQQIALVFETLLGVSPRASDLAVLRYLSPAGVTAADVAAYIHDHWMGSPKHPSLRQVNAAVRAVVEAGQ